LCGQYESQNKDERSTKEKKEIKQGLKPAIIVDFKVSSFNSALL